MSEYRAPEKTLGSAIPKPRRNSGTITQATTRRLTNLPIRVPSTDWAAVVTGKKQMFRTYNSSGSHPEYPVVPPGTECPRPCLLFAARHDGPKRSRRWEAVPGVLLAHRQEPLGSITPEDLVKEGHHFLPAFRFYWKQRYKRLGWRPRDMVSVIEVRPWDWRRHDFEEIGAWALRELYGDWLHEHNESHTTSEVPDMWQGIQP